MKHHTMTIRTTCPYCKGTGEKTNVAKLAFGTVCTFGLLPLLDGMFRSGVCKDECPACNGKGTVKTVVIENGEP